MIVPYLSSDSRSGLATVCVVVGKVLVVQGSSLIFYSDSVCRFFYSVSRGFSMCKKVSSINTSKNIM